MSQADTQESSHPSMAALREALFKTLQDVRADKIDLDKARAVNELGKTLIDTARVEVDFIKATGGTESPFIESKEPPKLPPGVNGVTVHRLRG